MTVLLILLTGQFMANVDTSVVNVAAPAIHDDLRASASELQLVVSGFVLTLATLLIAGARLGARFGHERVFTIGVAVFTGASLLCGLAPTTLVLILARLLQGAAAAIMVPQVLTGIQRSFQGADRARAIGYYSLTLSAGAVAGQVLGGVLVWANLFGSSWRPIFLVNVPIGIALTAAAARTLPRDRGDRGRRLDLPGAAALSLSVALAVVPLVLGRALKWPLWTVLALLACPLLLVAFGWLERRATAPLVNLRLLVRRPIAWGLVGYALALSTYFTMLFVLALYLQQGLGRGALYSGLSLVSWVAAFGLAAPVSRRLPQRFSMVGGFALLGAAHLAIGAGAAAHWLPGGVLMVLLGVGGFGLGIGNTAVVTHLTGSVEPAHAPELSGLIPTTAQLSGVLGVATFGTLYIGLSRVGGFAVVTLAFGTAALLGAGAVYRATLTRPA
jgi:MFS family permease